MIRIKNIQWDVDASIEKERVKIVKELGLPLELILKNFVGDEEDLLDFLSDEYGYCVFGFEAEEGTPYCRMLTQCDFEQVSQLDELSDFVVSEYLDCDNYAYGIFFGNSLIGYVTIGGADCLGRCEVTKDCAYSNNAFLLSDMFILEQYRRLGCGTSLIQFALKENWKTNGCYPVYLQPYSSEDGCVGFYKSLGFDPIYSDEVEGVICAFKILPIENNMKGTVC